LESSIRKPLAG